MDAIFLIAVIAVIVFLTVYVFKSSVRIRKGVADVDIKEGGVSALKVLLEIRNVTNKPIKKVAVIDYIPNIADLKKEFAEGTLKPTKVLIHGKKGTILRWELEELGPGEDRLISYSLSSKLSILGHFKLPRAKVIYREKRKERHVYSNTVGINT